jgi:hypothetical protein
MRPRLGLWNNAVPIISKNDAVAPLLAEFDSPIVFEG